MARSQKRPTQAIASNDALSQQYGGSHTGGWVSYLPRSWVPYVQLARLSPPAGLFLIYFPHLFGILQGAFLTRSPPREVLRVCTLLLGGSFFFSNAIHAWNDLVDLPVDRMVRRTQNRPIVRGAVSPRAAFVFTAAQAVATALCLLPFSAETALCTLPNLPVITYYPWAKRHTHFAQVILGFWLGWGLIIGSSVMGVRPWEEQSAAYLFAACVSWTTIYDTVYAHQDVEDDRKIGAKSMAVFFGERTKLVLWAVLGCMLLFLARAGSLMGLGLPYYFLAAGGCAASLGTMIARVSLESPQSCWWWFRYGFWLAGGSIAAGLLLEYLLQ